MWRNQFAAKFQKEEEADAAFTMKLVFEGIYDFLAHQVDEKEEQGFDLM